MAKKKNKQRSQRVAFLLHYKIELGSLVLVLSGTFLLIEDIHIRQVVFGMFGDTFRAFTNFFISTFLSVRHFIMNMRISDAIGIVLIIIATGLIMFRVRDRILDSGRFDLDKCPICNTRLERTRRKSRDYLVTTWLPLRRYSCMNNTCQWTGLLF
ncbi:hypothetical protein ACFL4G_01705 [Thermodesulfobacteriota bacterium]